jgi:hypothetical protein
LIINVKIPKKLYLPSGNKKSPPQSGGVLNPKGIKKTKYKKHKTTRERLVEFYGANFDQKRTSQKEIDWGMAVGKEAW